MEDLQKLVQDLIRKTDQIYQITKTLETRIGNIEGRVERIESHLTDMSQQGILGCAKLGTGFRDVVLRRKHEERMVKGALTKESVFRDYNAYVREFLKVHQNQSFYRQRAAHNYIYVVADGWVHVSSQKLIMYLKGLSWKKFGEYVRLVHPFPFKLEQFRPEKSTALIRILKNMSGVLAESKKNTQFTL